MQSGRAKVSRALGQRAADERRPVSGVVAGVAPGVLDAARGGRRGPEGRTEVEPAIARDMGGAERPGGNARGGTRTHDLRLRRPTLYPAELLARGGKVGNVRVRQGIIKRMPELPDVEVYLERLAPRTMGRPLTRMTITQPFVLRTVEPSPGDLEGRRVTGLRRLGKRVVIELEGEFFIVIHLDDRRPTALAGRARGRSRIARRAPGH